MAEKYLVWTWASLARSYVGATILGRPLYDAGFAAGVEKELVAPGTFELRSREGCAVLMEPYGTIFSHLIDMTEEQIEKMVLVDMGGTAPM
ncbi:hypothetical protein BVC93_13150 [Mycobacterium sp. MS1601]|nr:hypothetical protein BVC93_13150 [Mycobacterium sp. MS1601]